MMVSIAIDPHISVRAGFKRTLDGGAQRSRVQCSAPRNAQGLVPRVRSRSAASRSAAAGDSCLRVSADFANDELLPARHRQCLVDTPKQDFPVCVAVGADTPLEAANRLARDQAVAMNAHEARAEFLLQPGQRLFEQEFTISGSDRDVLQLRLEINDFLDGHQHVHLFPQIRDALLKVAKELAPNAWVRQCGSVQPLSRRLGDPKGLLVDLLSRSFRRRAQALGVRINSAFAGTYRFRDQADLAALFPRFLDRLPDGSVVMCHPGFVDAELRRLDPLTDLREREYAYFAGDGFPAVLERHGVALA